MSVVDASTIVDLLVPRAEEPEQQQRIIQLLPPDGDTWIAPDVLTFEVFAALRRHTLRAALTPDAAWRRLQRVSGLPIDLIPSGVLWRAAWALRDNVAAADSFYLATAQRFELPLITTDLRLARAAEAVGVTASTP